MQLAAVGMDSEAEGRGRESVRERDIYTYREREGEREREREIVLTEVVRTSLSLGVCPTTTPHMGVDNWFRELQL